MLPEGDDFDTLGGFVLDRLGRLPRAGDEFVEDIDGERVRLSVQRMDGWRVDRVRLTPAARTTAARDGGKSGA